MYIHDKEIQSQLLEVKKVMKSNISINNPNVKDAIFEMMDRGGKMLRPTFLLLFSQFGNAVEREKIIALAASLELLHTATLIHDDVVDKATLRRGGETIAHRFGEDVAVYAGDYLFVAVFRILAKYSSSLKVIDHHAGSMEKVLSGEIGQMNDRYNTEQSVENYIQNISGKTAELFALSTFLGVSESGASSLLCKKAYDIGLNCGIAFQIMDDYLDYTSDTESFGKPVLEDIRQGVYSLPVLFALQVEKEALLPLLQKKEAISSEELCIIQKILEESNALNKTMSLCDSYTQKALKLIESLPSNKESTKVTLSSLTEQLTRRIN